MRAFSFFDRARRVLFEASFYLVLILGGGFTLFNLGPFIETRFFPPVSKLTIVSIEPDANGGSRIEAEFSNLRSCEYIGINWFRTWPDGTFDPVPVTLLRKPGDTSSPSRPLGTQRSRPWIVGIPPESSAPPALRDCRTAATRSGLRPRISIHELPRPYLEARYSNNSAFNLE